MNPLFGARCFLRGFGLLIKPGVFPYVLIPLLINVALFTVVLILSIGQFEHLMAWVMSYLPDWLQWLSGLLWVLFGLTVLLVIFFTFSLVGNFIAAPFNGLLAEAVARHLGGQVAAEVSWRQALVETPKVVWNEGRKLGYFAKLAIPLLLLFIIPGLNLFAPLLWFIFSAWMLAVEYSDYPLGNRGLSFPDQRALLRQYRGNSLGFGATALVMTMIPLLNFIVMPVAVAGATAMWVDYYRRLK
ncbi:MAG: sulfate transporter CysZ [Pseudomonadota bacterium]